MWQNHFISKQPKRPCAEPCLLIPSTHPTKKSRKLTPPPQRVTCSLRRLPFFFLCARLQGAKQTNKYLFSNKKKGTRAGRSDRRPEERQQWRMCAEGPQQTWQSAPALQVDESVHECPLLHGVRTWFPSRQNHRSALSCANHLAPSALL